MNKEEIEHIKMLYQRNDLDLGLEKVEYRIRTVKKIFELIEEVENIDGELKFLGILKEGGEQGLISVMKQFKKAYVTMALRKSRWNVTNTAKSLSIHRQSLIDIIKQLGIEKGNAKL